MISDVKKFMEAAEQTTDKFNVRQTALYIGLQLEEMAEKLEAIFGSAGTLNHDVMDIVDNICDLSYDLKNAYFDGDVASANRESLLDADIDQMWVTIGSVLSQGADIDGAIAEVTRSNMSKMVDGKMQKDPNGKVAKPKTFSPPDLTPFVK